MPGRNFRQPTPPLAASLLNQMNELTKLLGDETELVAARKIEEHKQLLKRKQKLIIEHRASMKSLVTQPDLLKGLPSDMQRSLRTAAQKLAETIDRNARMLRSTVTAVQRLIQNIVSIVRSEVLPRGGYQNPKTAHLALGTYSPTCAPVAVRKSI